MKKYAIDGMGCDHCRLSVTKAIEGVKGVASVTVSLEKKLAEVEGEHSEAELIAAVETAVFSATPL